MAVSTMETRVTIRFSKIAGNAKQQRVAKHFHAFALGFLQQKQGTSSGNFRKFDYSRIPFRGQLGKFPASLGPIMRSQGESIAFHGGDAGEA